MGVAMEKEKIKPIDLNLKNKEFPEKDSVKKQEPRTMSFDVYFLKMQAQNSKVLPHHKAPMRHFAEQQGLTTATEEQFDKVFRTY